MVDYIAVLAKDLFRDQEMLNFLKRKDRILGALGDNLAGILRAVDYLTNGEIELFLNCCIREYKRGQRVRLAEMRTKHDVNWPGEGNGNT